MVDQKPKDHEGEDKPMFIMMHFAKPAAEYRAKTVAEAADKQRPDEGGEDV